MLQTQSTYMGTMMAHTALTVTAVAILGASNPVGWVLAEVSARSGRIREPRRAVRRPRPRRVVRGPSAR